MFKNDKNLQQTIVKDREATLQAGLLASMDILKEKFGFDTEKLNEFAEAYIPALKKHLGGKK